MAGVPGSLRAELVGGTASTPPFGLLLPSGWVAHRDDGTALENRLRDAARKVPNADSAQLAASVEALINQLGGGTATKDERLIATITQTESDQHTAEPMSMVLAWLKAPVGTRIAALAGELVANRGAAPMDDTGAILRWVDRASTPLNGSEFHTVQPTYLVRVPKSTDTAVMIRTTILEGVAEHRLGADHLNALVALSDGIASTFRWRRDA